jgi:5'-3' exonuclease
LEREGDSFSFEEIPFELEGPLPPVLQLISVLPPQSSYLVPRVFQDVMSNKLTQVGAMYPEEIQLDFIHADRFYQSIPQLPAINLPIMLAAYEANEQKLVGEEISRNQMMEKFVFM